MTPDPLIPDTILTKSSILISVSGLHPHPTNVQIYGDEPLDPLLVSSIAEHGIVEPLIIVDRHPDGFWILSGHRRWRAAIEAGLSQVPCRVIPPLDDELAETEILLESNRQREKTISQLMNEGRELERIEREKAKRRQGTRTDIVETLPQSETGKTRDKVAEHLGMSGRTYDKAKKVYKKAAEGDEVAQEQVRKLDAGETTISGAHREVQEAADTPEAPPPEENPSDEVEPARGLTPIVYVSDPESKQHSAGIWYQSPEMKKAERVPFYGALTPEGYPDRVIHPVHDPGMAVRMLRWIEMNQEKYTIPRLRFDKTDITLRDLRILALWGCIPEEEKHTVTVHYLDAGDGLPSVAFFDLAPQAAAEKALAWIADHDVQIRRIRFCDGDGGSLDTTIAGLEHLAEIERVPAPRPKKIPPATVQHLETLRDEIEAMLQYDRREYDTVRIDGRTIVVEVPEVKE